MKQPPYTQTTTNNITSLKTNKLKTLTVNVNGLNNFSKRNKFSNSLKTNKIDTALLQETHSTKTQKNNGKKSGPECSFGIQDPHTKLQV